MSAYNVQNLQGGGGICLTPNSLAFTNLKLDWDQSTIQPVVMTNRRSIAGTILFMHQCGFLIDGPVTGDALDACHIL